MPRKAGPPLYEKKIYPTTMPYKIPEHRTLPAIIPEKPSFLQVIKEGAALGIGSSLGQRMVSAVIGAPEIKVTNNTKGPNEYEKCMKDYNDKAACEYLQI